MTASRKLQEAVFDALSASEKYNEMIGDRYGDNLTDGTSYPYLTIGDRQFGPNNYDQVASETHRMTLLVWDRDNGAKLRALEIAEHIYLALNEADLVLGEEYAAEGVDVTSVSVELADDGVTVVASINLMVEVERVG